MGMVLGAPHTSTLEVTVRRLEFDQFEFPNHSTEEHLVLTLEEKAQSQSISEFLSRCEEGLSLITSLTAASMKPLSGSHGSAEISKYLQSFGAVSASEIAEASYVRLSDDPDQEIILLETPSYFVLYQWSTSA